MSECLKNNIPIIATVGHGKLAYFLKYVVDHFGTAKPTPTTSETYSKEHHEGHNCFCALDRTKVDSCPDVKYQLQTMFPDSLKKDLEDCLSGLSEVIQYLKILSQCQYILIKCIKVQQLDNRNYILSKGFTIVGWYDIL